MLSENDTMKMYMQQIAQYALISREEEGELADQIRKGSEAARIKLIRSNLRLVVKIAHDYKGLGVGLLDLISEGNIGLIRAVEKFNPAKGAKLSTYSAWWIKQSMRRALANQCRTIRIPMQSANKINKIKTARIKLHGELEREPTNAEIAEAVSLTERTVSGLRDKKISTISLHDPIHEGEEGEFRDIIPDESTVKPDDNIQESETINFMLRLIHHLDNRERRLLQLRFGLSGERPHTLQELAPIIGYTRERIRQIQNQALQKLRAMLDERPVENGADEEPQNEEKAGEETREETNGSEVVRISV